MTIEEVAVGTKVTYISQDPTKPAIHIEIIDEEIIDGIKVALKHKATAHLHRIFVPEEAEVAAAVGAGVDEGGADVDKVPNEDSHDDTNQFLEY